ncbi:MAG: DEAD/DEAH box helicase [Victivallaceae bacterium]
MVQNFETKLIEASSEETLKEAKQMLKGSKLVCAYREKNGLLNVVFQDKVRYEYTEIMTGAVNSGKCSCGQCGEKLCAHAVAGIMHLGRFSGDTLEAKQEPDNPARYAGLKYESFTELIQKSADEQHAELHIHAESAFPHVPSKWENAVLSVKMKVDAKEYIGNVNNIRQLHFSKCLAASLKLNYFTLHDKQIIRFLAVNAEAENSKLLLDSEQTSEFFHCLIDYPRFYKDGKRVIIHRENAEPVMLCSNTGLEFVLSPAVVINGSLLPLVGAKVITGRSGCWVGMEGEYWWVPGTVEVSWLRNFLRNNEQRISTSDTAAIKEIKDKLPLHIIETIPGEVPVKKCTLCLDGGFTADKIFRLNLRFDYDGELFNDDQGRTQKSVGKFWKRDEKYEKSIADELIRFGFVRGQAQGEYNLTDIEAAGVFLDRLIPQWMEQKNAMYLCSDIAALCGGGRGVPALTFQCEALEPNADVFPLHYKLAAGTIQVHWHQAVKLVRANHHYHLAGPRDLIKINRELEEFIDAASNVVQHVDDNLFKLSVQRCSIHYWLYISRKIPGAAPAVFYSQDFFASGNLGMTGSHAQLQAAPNKFEGVLRKYQEEGIEWMRQLTDSGFNVILADEMGLGKTIQTLALLASRLNEDSDPVLIICPASLVENWQRESNKFVPGFKTVGLSGTGRQEIWDKYSNYDLIIISYATARRDAEIIQNLKFSYLILDEAQHIKNPTTVNAKNCKAIKSTHRLVLTGTPLENSPDDLWSIFDYLHPGLLGSFTNFKRYYNGINTSKELLDDLAARVAPFIKRRTKDIVCKELPPKIEQVLYCEMENGQRSLYDSVLEFGRSQCDELIKSGKKNSNFEILTTLLRLRQICCHPSLLPDLHGQDIHSAKSELMKELVLQNIDSGHKMLLFSQFTSLLALIRPWLEEEGINYEYLDGSTKNRQQHVDNFNNNSNITVFLLSLKAGGTGLNLTSADTVIIYDPWWNPAVELQAADRTHRIGQTRPVSSIKLVVKDSIEEKILTMQGKKQEIFDNLIENPATYSDKLTIEELRFLFQ